MEKLMNALVQRRWLMLTLFVLLSGIGVYSWRQLAIDAYPDIADVAVGVATQVPGLAVAEIEQQITIPLERELNGIPRLKIMRSKNFFGISKITLVFEDGTDDYWARQQVLERINDIDLPFDAKPGLDPLTSPTGEIFRYVVAGNKSLRELTELNLWQIIPRLRQIHGIADVSNFGGITTQFQIEIDPNKLTKYNLSLSEVTESIERNNSNAGGSTLIRGDLSYVVRGVGLVRDLQDLGNIVVKTVGGTPVYIKDLGELKYGNLERKGIMGYVDDEINYEDGVQGMVQLLRYENPSKVLKEINKTIDELNKEGLPKGVKIHTFYDRTELVDATLDTISHTLLFGILLVIGVLIIFLGSPKGALLATITIPISLLIAFILMWLTDIPANLLSLGAIDFGIIVDGTIVMMETILKKREDNPNEPLKISSIARRTAEVAKPIFFATLIIIIAYLPLFAFDRVEQKLFTPMAFTLSYALLGALASALILIPGLAYMVYKKPQKVYHNRWLERLTAMYKKQTAKIIAAPKKLVAPMAAILVAVVALWIMVGKDFLPHLDEGSIWLQVQLPPGMSLEKSSEMATALREQLRKYDEVSYVMTQTGRDDEGVCPFSFSHIEVMVGLKPYDTWKNGRRKTDLIADMSAMVDTMPGYGVGFSQPIIDMVMDQIAGAHSDMAIKIYGEDITESRRIAEEVIKVVSEVPGAADIGIMEEPFLPQLQIAADRDKVAQYGLNIADVAELIEVAIGGKAVSQVFIDSRVYDVICRYNDISRDTPEKIGALMLTSGSGTMIPLSTVAEIKTTIGPSMISREMNQRFVTVRVNLRGRDLTSFFNEAQLKIEENVQYDHSKFRFHWDGQLENQRRAYGRLAVVVPITLAVMFLLLFFNFGKFRQAGLLIGMLPLAVFGGVLALVLRGMTFNVSSAVGFIALFGLSIQNGVIMLSHINVLRQRGRALKEAVIEGASHRLRPMMMTATVAILGLLPASLATGIGSDVQRPLATVIVYGLLFATVFTLFILPTLYYLMERYYEKKEALSPQKED
ncbi:CusA/CzcA family heavy metal efflux RND transporter [Parabacteroides sp. PF5-9]|uniref:efflux RND transporter permease subunit n=1 Tax=Parabacteroides sp. PF5-9 TaxID=1742404 RepID=UPI002473F072|nr:CusA/CzcA family heavy metal efflux RND transporter [Parabacteroides sp. PF5-9]MDH6357511.1 cobalt-zinc-cadmium resistance protein CzcA [Parabacteroides sp. PF5-9]